MIKKRLELLEQLQEIDLQVDVLNKAQQEITDAINGIEQQLVAAGEELAALEQRHQELRTEKATQEANLAAEQENITRSETNMKEIKTNKEFQAVGREITAARKQVTALEEQILQILTQIDEVAAEITTKRNSLNELEQNCQVRSLEKKAEIEKLQKDISADAERRNTIAGELPVTITKRYDTLRSQRFGRAVAIARDGYCLGCNMQLPPQMYNNLFKMEELISCPHCQRVLILKVPAA